MRGQVNYDPGVQGMEQVNPIAFQPVRAHLDDTAGLKANQLAQALGSSAIPQALQQFGSAEDQQERQKAQDTADSMTVGELGQKIKDGSILASQSPAFQGTLQHIYGENLMQGMERDTMSKIQTGELQFTDPQQVDEYLTKSRNEALEGQNQFAVAGFDKGYQAFRMNVFDTNARTMNSKAITEGIQQSSDNLMNVVGDVTGGQFNGTTDQAAQAIASRFNLLSSTSLLRDDARKTTLNNTLVQIAQTGNKSLVDALLAQKLSSGVTVASTLGGTTAAEMSLHAQSMDDQNQRKRVDDEIRPFLTQADAGELDQRGFNDWAQKNERWVTASTWNAVINHSQSQLNQRQNNINRFQLLSTAQQSMANAQQSTRVAIDQGNLAYLQPQQVMSPEGKMKAFETEQYAQQYMANRVQQEQMPFDKQVQFYSTNKVDNPQWKSILQSGLTNLASLGWTPDGKQQGQLNQQGQGAIDTFNRINAVNPAYAQQLAGGAYQKLSDIQFLMEKGGFPDANSAASLVYQGGNSGVTEADMGAMKANVASAVNDVVNPGFMSRTVHWAEGLWGNDQTNLTAVQADIRRRSELLLKSGQVPDAASAVKATVQYLQDPNVSTNINNTLYLNKDLPQVPKGEDRGKWVERFIDEVPGKVADAQDIGKGNIRMEPNDRGGYTMWTGGVPLTDTNHQVLNYSRQQVEKWIGNTYSADLKAKTAAANAEHAAEVQRALNPIDPQYLQ
ncbi:MULTISPECIES: hypothetical protein [Pseudomonas]|nr:MULTISPECIES: hypothetical protein [Pseudomonas]EGB99535.1 hypothetical protein G1E_07658 [Pseudomonas sp. TJI-51]MBA6121629.1 hypothetical protein [Pseudomonas juntendi]MBR7521806.1 hypothetical protein [Pseudomonas juntendi]MCF3155422.1 hypothetical protein [Pseudomonas juntendi]MCI0911122.1 hypothetical protein [Pseudomonas putida]